MSFEVRTTPHFEREAKALAKRYHSFKNDINKLIKKQLANDYQSNRKRRYQNKHDPPIYMRNRD